MFSNEFMRFLIGYQMNEFLPQEKQEKVEVERKTLADLTKFAVPSLKMN